VTPVPCWATFVPALVSLSAAAVIEPELAFSTFRAAASTAWPPA
jgi:hypothetical protein